MMPELRSVSIDDLLEQATRALEAEIETVREKPSRDILLAGRPADQPGGLQGTDFKFETHQPAIRFAEEIKARSGEKTWKVRPVLLEKNEILLRFPESVMEPLDELHVEWENDFVLQRTLQEIERLAGETTAVKERIRSLFEPTEEEVPGTKTPVADGQRNSAQLSAIDKALKYRSVFIWGPPGTGKTATLGFIIANYLKLGKTVLFASNTNRAVDVGLLSTLHALDAIGAGGLKGHVTRLGEAALDEIRVSEVTFDNQVEKIRSDRLEKVAEWTAWLARKKEVMDTIEKRFQDGKQPTDKQNQELGLIEVKIEEAGGQEKLEEKVDDLKYINERSVLRSKQLIATTLAKVCTSDLFYDLEFDAVVIDEGSMANLPYLMVLAARAQWHRVIVGDPMQLPPISLTGNSEAREFLERDIFTTVAGAATTDELFAWHDAHPGFTAFFDTQYRLKPSLAGVISSVFYEGRLKTDMSTAESTAGLLPDEDDRACHLVDTSKYNPVLEQKSDERGFNPVNRVHQDILEKLIRNMLARGIDPEEIGVMLPFRRPVYDLRNRFYRNGIRDVEVGTIHTFQGREKSYIIFDTVMSGETDRGSVRHFSVRLLDEGKNGLSVPRLLNVAFSRSRKELVILADMRHINHVYGEKFLGRLFERLR